MSESHPRWAPGYHGPGSSVVVEVEALRADLKARLFGKNTDARRVGRYVLGRCIGSGGLGVVYEARDPQLDRTVALKVLRKLRFERGATSELLREARAAASISHPNVVSVFDVGVEDDRCYIAMELLPGRTLSRWARERRRGRSEILEVATQAGLGLAAAHARGIVHQDFKPSNVMLDDRGTVKVLDFGLARVVAGAATPTPTSGPPALEPTASLSGAGTLAYMSPEQHRSEPIDARSDVYSFCVTLFELLCRERPFVAPSPEVLLVAKESQCVDPRLHPDVPPRLMGAIARGLHPDPRQRPADMAQMLEQLRPGPGTVRWRAALAFGGIAVAGVGALVWPSASRPCDRGSARAQRVWNLDVASRIEAEFRRSDLAFADDAWGRVRDALDVRVDAWRSTYAQACEASDDIVLDRRMACLDDRLAQLNATVQLLELVGRNAVEAAVGAALDLEDPADCLEPNAVADAGVSDEAGGGELRRANAAIDLGQYSRGLELAEHAGRKAGRAQAPLAQALAGLAASKAIRALGREAQARERATRSFELAGATSAVASAQIAIELAILDTRPGGELLRGLDWTRHAESLLGGAEDGNPVRAQVLAVRGLILSALGEYERARTVLEASLALNAKLNGDGHHTSAGALNSLATVLAALGQSTAALNARERVVEITESGFGGRHPHTARVYNNLGSFLLEAERGEEAQPHLERALTIFEETLGLDHPDLVAPLLNLARLGLARDDPAAALAWLQRCLDNAEARGAEPLPDVVRFRGQAYCAQGRYGLAREQFEGLKRSMSARDDPNSGMWLVRLNQDLARCEEREGRVADARRHYQLAADGLRELGPTNDPALAEVDAALVRLSDR